MEENPVNNEIEKFIEFLGTSLQRVDNLAFSEGQNNDQQLLTYKKILLMSFIDCMAKTIYPSHKNRKRFTSFMSNFTDWDESDQDRVSLLHLRECLNQNPEPKWSDLRQYVNELFGCWDSSSLIPIDEDPKWEDIQKCSPNSSEDAIFKVNNKPISLEQLKHKNLIYLNRCNLVHEFREAGQGRDTNQDKIHYRHTLQAENPWDLIYPYGFFKTQCDYAIENLQTYYKENRLDPYKVFNFGAFWISELNL
ncbi:MAG: hypothetical protein HRT90_12075 [Candidatus Margulisbacteria bacterium]|nr:hypothetical protein [Candidatus Margulisiibacteriota bacterium]